DVVVVELIRSHRRPERDFVVRIMKVLRHHSDHDTRIPIDQKSLAHDRLVSAKSGLPQRGAQDDRRRILFITFAEQPAARRLNSEYRQKIRGYECALESHWLTASDKIDWTQEMRAHRFERPRCCL